MNSNEAGQVFCALDSLALELTIHRHQWSVELRQKYEAAIKIVQHDEKHSGMTGLLAERDRLRAALDSVLDKAAFSGQAVKEYSPAAVKGYDKIFDIARAALKQK